MPQDVELFGASIRDNIARMGESDPESVIGAARLAGVHDMILRLPGGYDTELGAGGATLSGGQRQRIALARAVFGDPRFVVLDEPNANLDQLGEDALVSCLQALKGRGATVIVIAHRPSILRHVDKILVLRDGAVQLFGPRDEVIPKVTGQVAAGHLPKQPGQAHG
ncbi:MAG: ATP-binding cassette domain-containing protein [Alphaproteobacteria bacterium]|nr:ATP-binding cassette domain-containing protein [Alphaproteobacteria bacterium]